MILLRLISINAEFLGVLKMVLLGSVSINAEISGRKELISIIAEFSGEKE